MLSDLFLGRDPVAIFNSSGSNYLDEVSTSNSIPFK